MEEGIFTLKSELFLERDLDEVMNGNLNDIINWLTYINDRHQSSGNISVEVDTGYCNGILKFYKNQFIKE